MIRKILTHKEANWTWFLLVWWVFMALIGQFGYSSKSEVQADDQLICTVVTCVPTSAGESE